MLSAGDSVTHKGIVARNERDHVRKTARLEDVRLHDLRHSLASVAASGGLSLVGIGTGGPLWPQKRTFVSASSMSALVPIADLADRHRVRKTAVEDLGQLRDAPRLVLAAELPPMRSVRAQLFHRDR